MKNFYSAFFSLSLITAGSFAQAPGTTTIVTKEMPTAPVSSEVGVSSRDGITLSGTDVLVTRNGVTKTLTEPLELPNGVRVQLDGTILAGDGGKFRLRSTQVLTFDGKILDAPIVQSVAPATVTNTTTTTTTAEPAPTVTTIAPATTPVLATPVAPTTPTIVIEKSSVTKPEAEAKAAIEAERRAHAGSKPPIQAGENAQK